VNGRNETVATDPDPAWNPRRLSIDEQVEVLVDVQDIPLLRQSG
jgi:hypothetical protein